MQGPRGCGNLESAGAIPTIPSVNKLFWRVNRHTNKPARLHGLFAAPRVLNNGSPGTSREHNLRENISEHKRPG